MKKIVISKNNFINKVNLLNEICYKKTGKYMEIELIKKIILKSYRLLENNPITRIINRFLQIYLIMKMV